MLQTNQQFPGLDNLSKENLKQNPDGSFDIYFVPSPPQGLENNWIQTVPGKGWNTIFRLYGPLQSFYDKTLEAWGSGVGGVMRSSNSKQPFAAHELQCAESVHADTISHPQA